MALQQARKEFSDKQKALIYARDRATCCFSGANLWLLDEPLRPGLEADWVDHVKPSAKGGGNGIENGVCASATFNAKKRHNTADQHYLFEEGLPTALYFEMFGSLRDWQIERLRRLSQLEPEDWFLNRAVTWVYQALCDRCDREFYDTDYKRDADYWLSAAFRKIEAYQKLCVADSLEKRGVIHISSGHVERLLELREVRERSQLVDIAEELYPTYRRNYVAWAEYFWDAETDQQRELAYQQVVDSQEVCKDVRQSIITDFLLRYSS